MTFAVAAHQEALLREAQEQRGASERLASRPKTLMQSVSNTRNCSKNLQTHTCSRVHTTRTAAPETPIGGSTLSHNLEGPVLPTATPMGSILDKLHGSPFIDVDAGEAARSAEESPKRRRAVRSKRSW